MNPKLISYEKLINKMLIPKINGIFSQYSKLRIIDVKINDFESTEPEFDIDKQVHYMSKVINMEIVYNMPIDNYLGVAAYLGYLIINLSGYIFTEDIKLYIKNVFSSEVTLRTAYSTRKYRLKNEDAYRGLIGFLT